MSAGGLTARGRVAVLAGCAVVALLVALYAAAQVRTGPAVPTGSVRLGPDAGEDVAAYAARARASLPASGTTALALVQFTAGRTVADAAAVGATPVEAVLRVPIPRVQTALRFEPLPAGSPVAAALDAARQRAAFDARAAATRTTPDARAAAVAAAEATALDRPGCPCVTALVVSADGTALRALAAAPLVRVVEAAPPGTTLPELALSPLLPEQAVRADPLPDDGPVP